MSIIFLLHIDDRDLQIAQELYSIVYLSVTILTVHEALVASGTAASRDLLPSFSRPYLLNFLKYNIT